METANESVYLGREGTGAAQILGSPINVWGQVFAQQRQKASDEAAARKQQIELTKWKDKQIKDWEQTKFDKPWQMYAEQMKKETTDYQQTFRKLLDEGYDVSEAKRMTDDYRADIERKISRTLNADVQYKDGMVKINKNPFIDKTWAHDYLKDKLVTADIDQADLEASDKVMYHPRAFNPALAMDDFADGIKNTVKDNVSDLQSTGYGLYVDKVTQELKFFKGVDDNGNLIPGVKDEDITRALNRYPEAGDSYLWRIIAERNNLDDRLDRDKITELWAKVKDNPPADLVKEVRSRAEKDLLSKQESKEKWSLPRMGQYPSNSSAAKGKTKEADIIERDRIIQAVQTPFGAMGELEEARPETLQFAKQFIGGKFGGMPIEDVEVVKAGKKSAFDNTTKNYDRYVFKVTEGKQAGEANITTREMDLTKGDYGFWNTLLNTTPGNKKIDIGDLTKQNEVLKQNKNGGEYDDL